MNTFLLKLIFRMHCASECIFYELYCFLALLGQGSRFALEFAQWSKFYHGVYLMKLYMCRDYSIYLNIRLLFFGEFAWLHVIGKWDPKWSSEGDIALILSVFQTMYYKPDQYCLVVTN